jgi:hypothetical protein
MISSRTAFAHNNDSARFRRAIDDEASELSNFARSLMARAQTRPGAFDRPIDDMKSALKAADAPAEAEGALEICGRQLRRRWLDAASSAANRSYRSPTTAQFVATATGHSTNFGYERELQPTELEQRCTSFFGSTAGRSITRWSRVVKRQWLRCCICSTRSSRSVIKDH